MSERRQYHRAIINKRIWICDFDQNILAVDPQDCVAIDISEGGACIQCPACLKENQLIVFTYQDFMEEGFRSMVGVVMWRRQYSERDFRYGIKFLGLSTQMLSRIQDIVAKAADETSTEV